MPITITATPARNSPDTAKGYKRGVILPALDAVIAPEKLRDYILSPTHPDGRAKAAYLARLGYFQADWQGLEADIRSQILSRDARPARSSAYGRKYEILGPLTGPNGTAALVRTIWIIRTGETAPRLVTLVPEDKS